MTTMAQEREERTSTSVFGILRNTVAWFVILLSAAIIAVAVLIPRITGSLPLTVTTGSMEPNMPRGSLIVVRETAPADITIGSVLTYQLESGKPTLVTHRVVGVTAHADGTRSFTTQGDANNVADREPVEEVQIKGTVWYTVPYLGWSNNLMDGAQRQTAVYVVAGGLGLYALVCFGAAVRGKDRKRRHASPQNTLSNTTTKTE